MTYNFRYSRFMPGGILNILFLGLFLIGSILVSTYILFFLGFGGILGSKGSVFWDNNPKFAIALIFLLPVIFIIIFIIIASTLYRHFIDSKGILNIFNNYAILYYEGKEITLEKGEFSLSYDRASFGRNGAGNFLHPVIHVYVIKIKNKRYKICESIQEGYELTTFWQRMKRISPELSLSIAMNALIKLEGKNKKEKKKNEILYIGDVQITLNVSTLDVFEGTNYFVDIENALPIESVPFIVCDIYENKDSEHLIAEVGLIDDEKNDKLPTTEELKKRVIVSGLELDEYIKK